MGDRGRGAGSLPKNDSIPAEPSVPDVAEICNVLQSHSMLGVLPAQVLEGVAAQGEFFLRRATRILVREGDPARWFFFLLDGALRVFHQSPAGDQALLKIFSPPALFGEIEVLAGLPHQEYVQCMTDCRLLRLPAAALAQLLEEQPTFALHVLRDVAVRFCLATNNEKNLAFKLLQPRMARMLLDYAQAFGRIEANDGPPSVVLNQAAVARDLAISRQHAVKSLQALIEMGLLGREGNRYFLLDVDRLMRLAGGVMSYVHRSKWGAAPE